MAYIALDLVLTFYPLLSLHTQWVKGLVKLNTFKSTSRLTAAFDEVGAELCTGCTHSAPCMRQEQHCQTLMPGPCCMRHALGFC